jgi:AcrR family transcriptional regulator
MSIATRDQIIDEALRLFSEHGYAGTSVAKIEAAVGLSPGAGGLYHHFNSKEEVLAAGIERRLARLDSLREIRRVLSLPEGGLTSELTLIARYMLAELDNETELMRLLAREARNRPELLTVAVDQLINSTFSGFAAWIGERAQRPMPEEEAAALAALGLGSLFSSRLLRDLIGVPSQVQDETLVETWVKLIAGALGEPG